MEITSFAREAFHKLPDGLQNNLMLKAFGLLKVPMIYFLRPRVIELNEKRCEIVIPLTRRSKNHLGSMYFGALSAGADVAGGLQAMKLVSLKGKNVSLAFKDFNAKFLKRAEGDTHFICEMGSEISDFVDTVLESGERHNMPVKITAYTPEKLGNEAVAEFTLTLSLKRK